MTDRYDEMRVSPDASQAEELRQRLHARLDGSARGQDQGQAHPPVARLDRRSDQGPMEEDYVSVDSPTRKDRGGRRQALAAAAVVALVVVAGAAIAVGSGFGDDATPSPTGGTTVAPDSGAPPGSAPAEFTACVRPGPGVHDATEERTDVSLPEGAMTITRGRGGTWQLDVSDVSDPRLDGSWYVAIDGDQYDLPGDQRLELSTWTYRIETDEGAWQGSALGADLPSPDVDGQLLVLSGEGAYEGFTAVANFFVNETCPNTRGYIVEGSLPPAPVPRTEP